jgi:hypothetical protein
MLTTVDFDHQLRLGTIEIDDKFADRFLPTELQIMKLFSLKLCP